MSKQEVVQKMMIELDHQAKQYAGQSNEETRKDMALEFKHTAMAYNQLLRDMFKTVKRSTFYTKVEIYTEERKENNWI